jgi:2-hydroxy-6-oxonona-2,4-dienedioate hydrolase
MRTRTMIGLASAVGTTAAVGGAFLRYRHDLKAKTQTLEARHQLAETSKGEIEFAREGSGPAALVIHGAGGGFDQGLWLGREMLGEGYNMIAPSRFGYLGTPVPEDASHAAQADAHAALLDHLGIAQAIVMGVSAGAPSAIELAVRHPERVRALILVVPRAYDPENRVGVDETLPNKAVIRLFEKSADFPYWLSTKVARQALVRFFGVEPGLESKAPAEERGKITAIINDMLPLSARVQGIHNDTTSGLTDPGLEQIKAPTLVISAEDDLYHTLPGARYTAEHIRGARLRVFETGGHLLVSHGSDTQEAIAQFLRDSLGHQLPSAAIVQSRREEAIGIVP